MLVSILLLKTSAFRHNKCVVLLNYSYTILNNVVYILAIIYEKADGLVFVML